MRNFKSTALSGASPSTVLTRLPQHVGRALVVGVPPCHEQKIREAVDVFERRRRDPFARMVVELDHQPLGAAAYGAGEVQVRGGGASTRQDERAQRCEVGIEMIDLLLQPLHLRVSDGHTGAAGALRREAEVGFDVEQVVLNACQHGVKGMVGSGVEPRQAEHRVDLVQRAVRSDTQIVFLAPLAAAERGRAVIAGAGVNPVENDHRPRSYSRQTLFAFYLPIAQTVSIMTTMAMNCSSTRSLISFCDLCGEPPRIMLTRPRTSTTATAPIAIGTKA